MNSILEVHELVKKYGATVAVNGISFDIKEGEIFSLLGPNGAGKTTTISVLSTLLAPTAGDAMIGGFSIRKDQLAIRRMIGVIPQELALYDDLSARENLYFWGSMYDLRGKQLKTRVDEILEQIGLTDKANQKIKSYSGGMKRRVNIGVGLLHRPRLIFMDEPTVGIDAQSRRAILDSVKSLNAQGMTVLYTTHYMEEAQELSDRVGIIDHGDLIALGTQSELTMQVGERETLVLHVGELDAPEEFVERLKILPGAEHVQRTDHEISINTPKADELLSPVVALSNELNIKLKSVDMQAPDLETVFLHLTGRALRD